MVRMPQRIDAGADDEALLGLAQAREHRLDHLGPAAGPRRSCSIGEKRTSMYQTFSRAASSASSNAVRRSASRVCSTLSVRSKTSR